MPIYEYVCNTCSHRFDKLRPICEGDSERKLSVFAAFASDDSGSVGAIAGAGGCGGCGPSGCACSMTV